MFFSKIIQGFALCVQNLINGKHVRVCQSKASFETRHIDYVGYAVDGGNLDYAGRIYVVDGQEYFVRLFDYVDPSGKATVVVRPDGYKKIVWRTGNDNQLSRMKLVDELDAALKLALREYIASHYCQSDYRALDLKLG